LEFEMRALEMMPDHVHLFASCPPKWSPAEVVRRFKGRRSRLPMQEFPQLKRPYRGGKTLGAEGYSIGTAGHVSAETIKRYMEESQHI
jgi:putative transposase